MLRRWRGAWPRRGRFWVFVPDQEAQPPAEFPPPLLSRVGLRGRWALLSRRGRFYVPGRPYDVPGPSVGHGRASRRPLPTRRGQFHEPPWPQVQPEPSVWRPGWQRPADVRRRFAALLRRGRFFNQPSPFGVGAAGGVGEGNRRALAIRRGQFHEPPWPQVAAQPSVWRPSVVRAVNRLAGRPYRRGQFHEPPWPQAAAEASVWRPQVVRAVLRLAGRPIRRGAFHEPPWPQATPAAPTWVPTWQRRRRPFAPTTRRGEFLWTPPRPAGVPTWLRTRPRPVPALARRGQFHEPRWVEGPQSVWRPDPVCQSGNRPKWPTHRPRRGRFAEPRWPQAQQFIGDVPRWVEGGTAAVGVVEGAGGGTGQVEGGTTNAGHVEGQGSI